MWGGGWGGSGVVVVEVGGGDRRVICAVEGSYILPKRICRKKELKCMHQSIHKLIQSAECLSVGPSIALEKTSLITTVAVVLLQTQSQHCHVMTLLHNVPSQMFIAPIQY